MGGIDESDSNVFKIHSDASLASNSDFKMDASGNITIGNNLEVSGSTTLNGAINLGSAADDDIAINGRITSNIIPKTDNNIDLGSTDNSFKDAHIQGEAKIGTVTTTGLATVNELSINKSLFQVAGNNTANTKYIGFFGLYNDGSDKYTGLFRDADDPNRYKLFSGTTTKPGDTVDITVNGFANSDLEVADIRLADTNNSHHLAISWNEDDTADRTL